MKPAFVPKAETRSASVSKKCWRPEMAIPVDVGFDLQIAGYKPLLAHPERYLFYHGNFDEYKKLKKAGCEFQINLLSATGYYGEAVFQTAKKLLDNGMIDFAGSDVHHKNHIKGFNNKVGLKDTTALKEAIAHNKVFL